MPPVAGAPERQPDSTDGDGVPSRPKPASIRAFDWALHPVAAAVYPVAPILLGAAGSAPGLAYGVAAALTLAAVVLVHYDRRAGGDPSSWWTVMVLLTGPFAYLPYTFVRRRGDRRAASPIGLVLAGVGAAGMLLAAFLPVADDPRLFTNASFFDGGDGWVLVCAAVVAAVGVGLAARASRGWAWLAVLCRALGVLVAVWHGSGSALDLYPYWQPDLSAGPSARADPGVGIYAAAVAGALCVLGGLMADLTAWGVSAPAARHRTATPPVA
jgi:hypothetical protein